jgi:small basic protein
VIVLLPFIALLAGALLAKLILGHTVQAIGAQYLAVACLAGFDTICGGVRSGLEGKFHNDVFLTGFVSNTLIAFFLAWLGDQIGINLLLAAVLVLGSRIFINLSLIRRFILTKLQDEREKRRLQRQTAGQTTS